MKEDDCLVTYIKTIEELEMPNWMDPADRANKIRNHRNLVHVKLCLKDDAKINKSLCEEVIQDLKVIIDTRIKI